MRSTNFQFSLCKSGRSKLQPTGQVMTSPVFIKLAKRSKAIQNGKQYETSGATSLVLIAKLVEQYEWVDNRRMAM